MKPTQLFVTFALCAAGLFPTTLGCQTQVIGGQGGSGGEDTTSGMPTSASGVPTSGSGIPTNPGASGNARPAEGGYIVTVANYPSSCNDPGIKPNCSSWTWWSAQFELPDTALVPGTVLPLSGLDGIFSEQLAQVPGEGQCGYGGGTFLEGSVKVVAVSGTELTLEVTGTKMGTSIDQIMDGTYVIPICSAPTPKNDGPAIAMKHSETPGNNGTSTAVCTGGPYIDPDTLMLYLSNLGQSCVDPLHHDQGCVEPRYQIAIQLPVNLQKIGSIPLQGLATMSLSDATQSPGACADGAGLYSDGTINITAIDATKVTFTLSGTEDTGLGLGNANGTYTAPRCF